MTENSNPNTEEWRGPLGLTRKRVLALGVVAVVVVALIAGAILGSLKLMARQEWVPGTMPVSDEIEEKFGVRFTFLAVTAEGGMAELRYRVIDEDKAANFGHFTETAPMLIDDETGKIVDVTIMGLHNHRAEPGRMYYILYRNTEGAVKSGHPVTIAIGNYELANVVPW
jgi:hypothetical protein